MNCGKKGRTELWCANEEMATAGKITGEDADACIVELKTFDGSWRKRM